MIREEFNTARDKLLCEAESVMTQKMRDYADENVDCLQNFRIIAELTGLPARQVWVVYFLKQVVALSTWARKGSLEGESVLSRFSDVVNYAQLGFAIHCEEEGGASE